MSIETDTRREIQSAVTDYTGRWKPWQCLALGHTLICATVAGTNETADIDALRKEMIGLISKYMEVKHV